MSSRISLTLHHAASWIITHICCTKEWIKTRELIKKIILEYTYKEDNRLILINSKATSNSEFLAKNTHHLVCLTICTSE